MYAQGDKNFSPCAIMPKGGFYLDGQCSPLHTYLSARPEKREELKKRIKEGKLLIGP